MDALATDHDAAVQIIDTSIVRVHQHAACIARNKKQSMGRSRGGLTSKIHAVVDTNGRPIRLVLTTGEAHDNRLAAKLLSRLKSGAMLLADRAYDADWIRTLSNSAALGQTSRQRGTAKRHSASAHIFTVLATRSSGSSTRLSSVGAWQLAMTSSLQTISRSSSLHP
jgi:transposase